MEWNPGTTAIPAPQQALHEKSTPPDKPLHFFQLFAARRFAWWRGLVALLIALALALVLLLLTSIVQYVIAFATGALKISGDEATLDTNTLIAAMTNDPVLFGIGNLQLGCGILVALGGVGLGFWVRPWFAANVTGRIRWALSFQCIVIAFLTLGVWNVVLTVLEIDGDWKVNEHAIWLFVVVLITTPIQCAGEEFAFRGVLSQTIGSWLRNPLVAFIVPTLVSATLFGFAHGPGDFLAWLTFASMGVVFSVVVRMTGGLEGSIALHIANNVALMAPVALTCQLGDMMAANGAAGSAASYFLSVIPNLVAAVLIVLWCRWRKVTVTRQWPAPVRRHEPFSFPRDGQRDPFAPPTGLVEVPGGPGERSQWRPAPDARPGQPQGDGSPVAGERRDW